jgi:hypothetical protein
MKKKRERNKEKRKMNFYFASQFRNIRYIKPMSELSFWPHVVHNLNRYHLKSGEIWKNDDLEKDYLLTPKICFKKEREPDGIPHLYTGMIDYNQMIVKKDFPYIFKNKIGIKVRKMTPKEHLTLINLSESIQDSFFNLDL